MKELAVSCMLYMDLQSDFEKESDALDRLIRLLDEHGIAISVGYSGIQIVAE